MTWDKVPISTLNITWIKVYPYICKIKDAVSSFQDSEDANMEFIVENSNKIDKIVPLGKALHLEVIEKNVEELIEKKKMPSMATEYLDALIKVI